MSDTPLVQTRIDDGVAHVRLARPEKRNAFDDHTAAALADAFRELAARGDVRAVVLGGEGKAFCAGGDLAWMRRVADYTDAENLADAAAFQAAFDAIDRHPHPVIARVQGAALGGGAGLVAVCDVVVCADDARLGFPEVRLGLVPGVVAPYVVRRIGPGAARRLFLTGRVVDASEARRIGLVDDVVAASDLDGAVAGVLAELAQGAPGAQARAKTLVRDVREAPDREAAAMVARRAIADARASAEGRAGTEAFLARKDPPWRT
jgi:methylglutaconyl-CoA hydratase